MFFEGWFTVGSTVVLEPLKLEGVVEEVSLRATTLRDVGGQLIRVHNSQIHAVRRLPAGASRLQVELFVHDGDGGRELVERVARIVPTGPTAFVRPPFVRETTALGGDLHRITVDTAVAVGASWLATELLPSLLKGRAADDLIVHGPIILPADEAAATRFARAEQTHRHPRRRRSSRAT
jgi:hypothetical protein